MKKRIVLFSSAFVFIVFSFLTCNISAAEKPIKIVFQNNYPTKHSRLGEVTIGKWLDAVEKTSQGRIKFERHWAGEPVPAKEALSALSNGLIDMLVAFPPYYSGEVAIADVSAMPQNYKFAADIYDLWWNSPIGEIINRIYQERVNVKVLFPIVFAPENFQISKKSSKVKQFSDFQGKKIRAGGGMIMETVKAIGASPVHTHGGEYYTAMQRGTVDAGLMTTYSLETYNMWEVSDQVVDPPILNNCWNGIYINKDKWEKIPVDLQNIMLDEGMRLAFRWLTYITIDDARIVKKARQNGIDFYVLPEQEQDKMWAATEKVWDLYIERCKEQGYEQEAKQIRQILKERFNSYR
jgi:TRAP-type C4-dicarboxylate transport system substrate-binding protein